MDSATTYRYKGQVEDYGKLPTDATEGDVYYDTLAYNYYAYTMDAGVGKWKRISNPFLSEETDPLYSFVSNKGISIPDVPTLIDMTREEFKRIFGADVDTTNTETPMGRLIENRALLRRAILGINAQNAYQLDINHATGYYLDCIGSIFQCRRNKGTNAIIRIKVTGDAKTMIPSGSRIKTSGGIEFAVDSDITIDDYGNANGTATAIEEGKVGFKTGDVNQIASTVIGWKDVVDTSFITIGQDSEPDGKYRNRLRKSRTIGISFMDSLHRALNDANVTSYYMFENYTGEDVQLDTRFYLPGHSVFICVQGGLNESIAKAIYRTKSVGAGLKCVPYDPTVGFPEGMREETVRVDNDYGSGSYNITFYRAAEIDLKIGVYVNSSEYSGIEEIDSLVKDAVIKWSLNNVSNIEGLKVGLNISPYEIAAAVSDQIPELRIRRVTVTNISGGGATEGGEYKILPYQVGKIERGNITLYTGDDI